MAFEEEDCHWTELLPENPLFGRLRENVGGTPEGASLVCVIRGDFFVWSEAEKALLTTNLKRIKAYPSEPQVFQTLVCTRTPMTPVLELLPSPAGGHIALCCRHSLFVPRLARHRGEHGEFGGGQKVTNCGVTLIANELFSIYRDLELVQGVWHPSQPALCLLTSDNILRLYPLASPDTPLTTLPLVESPISGYSLEDPVVAFSLCPDSIFALRDNGDIHKSSLVAGPPCPPTLPMHPEDDANYGSDSSSLLVLPSTPSALIIASCSGMIYHCIYLQQDQGGEEDPTAEMLYVVESVKLDLTRSASTPDPADDTRVTKVTLVADPVVPHKYYAVHSDGVHMVSLPWLANMEAFATSSMGELLTSAEAEVEHLLAIEPDVIRLLGMAVVSEPLLGCVLIVLTSDCECLPIPLDSRSEPHPPPIVDMDRMPRPLLHPSHGSGFEKVIHNILCSPPDSSPRMRHFSGHRDRSQEECFKFLSQAIQQLRTRYLIRQRRAKAELKHRIDVLCRQKQQQEEALHVFLQDEIEAVLQHTEELDQRVFDLTTSHQQLIRRVEQLVCRLDAQSPVLSEAEQSMKKELEELRGRQGQLQRRLYQAQRKLEFVQLDFGGAGASEFSLSASQSATVIASLAESGKNLKGLMQQIRSLNAMTPTN